MRSSTTLPGRSVPLLAWSAVALDGFDVVALAVVFPVLLKTGVWDLTPASASIIATIGLLGMAVGAIASSSLSARIGSKNALIASVVCFSVGMALSALSPSAAVFTIFRFITGLGLGGCLPIGVTMVAARRYRDHKSSSATTTMMTGYPLGGVVCALLGILMVPAFGWRSIFVVGAAPAVVLVPLMFRYLPRPAPVVEATDMRIEEHDHPDRDALTGLFRDRGARATLAFWVATFMGLMLIYGLNTWLPQIMSAAGYSLGNSLGFLLTLNLGAIMGQFLGGWLADRRGVRPANISWFAGAAVFLAMFALPLPDVFLYVPLFLAGIFTFSSQSLTYAYTQRFYPEHLRAAGVGWAAGVGRVGAMCGPLLGGALLTIGIAYPWGFYIFALAGALGALATWLVPKAYASAREREAEHSRVALEASE